MRGQRQRRKSSIIRGAIDNKQSKEEFFQKVGYAGKIVGLTGVLEQYNGVLVKPKIDHSTGMYEVVVERAGGDIGLVIKERNLEVVVDYRVQVIEAPVGTDSKTAFTGSNRGNVGDAMSMLSSQLRAVMRQEEKKAGSLSKVFQRFDIDGNGTIDKLEVRRRASCIACALTEFFVPSPVSGGV
jgi:hypothetical protein